MYLLWVCFLKCHVFLPLFQDLESELNVARDRHQHELAELQDLHRQKLSTLKRQHKEELSQREQQQQQGETGVRGHGQRETGKG